MSDKKSALLITIGAQGQSSRSKFQVPKFICDEYNTTILTLRTGNIDRDIWERASEVRVPIKDNLTLLNAIFLPLYSVFLYLRKDFDVLFTTQDGITTIPGLFMRILFNIRWSVIAFRNPDGFRNIRRMYNDLGLNRIRYEISYILSYIGYYIADIVICHDYAPHIDDISNEFFTYKGGTDCQKISEICDKEQIHENTVSVTYVGPMYYHRGMDLLFESINQCEAPVELTLAGPTADHNKQPKYENNMKKNFTDYLSETPNCQYLGVVPHDRAIKIMDEADIGVCLLPFRKQLTHYNHSYPLKIYEYMCTGNAVIASNTPALSQFLTENQLVDDEASHIASRIDFFYQNPDLLENIQRLNKQKVQDFCWEKRKELIKRELQSAGC